MYHRIAVLSCVDDPAGCMGWGEGTLADAKALCARWTAWSGHGDVYVVAESTEERPASWLTLADEVAAWEAGERP